VVVFFPDGSAEELFDSLEKVALLPNTTQICAAHEYTLENIKFARHIEPDNIKLQHYQQICQIRREQNLATLPCLLGTEKEINPFFTPPKARSVPRSFTKGRASSFQP